MAPLESSPPPSRTAYLGPFLPPSRAAPPGTLLSPSRAAPLGVSLHCPQGTPSYFLLVLVFWLFSFFLLLLPLYHNILMCFSFYLLHVMCDSDSLVLTLVCILAYADFGFPLYWTFWYSDSCLYFDSDSCLALIKSIFHFTPACIWVLPLHLPFTVK